MAVFLFNGLGLSLLIRAKLVSTNDWPSISSIRFRFFPSESEEKILRRISHEPIGGTPRHVRSFFSAKNRRSDLPVFNIKQNLAEKLDPTLKISRLKEIRFLTHFCA